MKKKILFILPALMLGMSLAACGEEQVTHTPEEAIEYVSEVLPTLFLDAAGMPGRLKKTYDVVPGDTFLAMTTFTYEDTLEVNIEWTSDRPSDVTIKNVTNSGGIKVENRVQISFKTVYKMEDRYSSKITGRITCEDATPVEVYFNTDVKHLNVRETTIREFKEGYKDAQYNKTLANPVFASSDTVSVYGYVVANFEPTSDHLYSGAWIQNGEDGLQLYAGTLSTFWFDLELKVGDLIRAIGYGAGYNGLLELKPNVIEKITVKGDLVVADPVVKQFATADGWSAAELLNKDGNAVFMKNLVLKTALPTLVAGSHWTIALQGTKADGTTKVDVQLYVNYHIGKDAQNALKPILEGLVVGTTTFDLKAMISWYNTPQLTLAFFNAGTTFVPSDCITIH